MKFLLEVNEIVQPGDENCLHSWVFSPTLEIVSNETYPYKSKRICGKCGRLENVELNYISTKTTDFNELYEQLAK